MDGAGFPDDFRADLCPSEVPSSEPSDGTIAAHDAMHDMDSAIAFLLHEYERLKDVPGVAAVYGQFAGEAGDMKFNDNSLWGFAEKYSEALV